MVKCHFTKKKFLAKLVPCHALNADFGYQIIVDVIRLQKAGAHVLCLINDNNKVNQSVFSKFTPIDETKPWIVKHPGDASHPLFIMYDFVHLLKNLRNNWHTEKMQMLQFSSGTETKYACWSDLVNLYKHESDKSMKLSKLTKASVYPRKIEKQKVSLVLQVFCDRTSAALISSETSTPSSQNTAELISLFTELWKLVNCKSKFAKDKDPRCMVIDSPTCEAIDLLQQWANFTFLQEGPASKRQKTLTRDTSRALSWSCNALISMAKYLLETPDMNIHHDYICPGFFQQDDLERHFGHFRMAGGGNYYITVQHVIATHNIDRARMMLSSCEDIDLKASTSGHSCDLCTNQLTNKEMDILQDIHNIVSDDDSIDIDHDTTLSLFYAAGYVAFKHDHLRGKPEHFEEGITDYLEALNRGSLQYPSPGLYDITLLAYLFVTRSPEPMCRNRLLSVLETFPDDFQLDIEFEIVPMRRLANILMKNSCLLANSAIVPANSKREDRKTFKLQSTSQR